MRLMNTIAALGVTAGLGAGGTAYAATSSSTSSGSPPPASHALPSKRRARTILQRADYATVELRVKGRWMTYELDRGKVTAVSPTSITLLRPDGHSVTEAISAATRYRGVTSEAGIHTDRPAAVLSEGGTARWIRQKPADDAPSPTAS